MLVPSHLLLVSILYSSLEPATLSTDPVFATRFLLRFRKASGNVGEGPAGNALDPGSILIPTGDSPIPLRDPPSTETEILVSNRS